MSEAVANQKDSSGTWAWRALAGLLIVTGGVLHAWYLTHNCPLDLAPDEAHYWDWSRHLDWSYYSKGPLVAWLIHGSDWLAGRWAEACCGSAMPAVRLPAILCGMLLLVSLHVLTIQVYRNERLAFLVVAGALTLPPVWAVSTLMTIDAPYTCLWGWALIVGHQAVFRHTWWAWPLLGFLVGLGILAKYTMVLFLPSLGLFLLTSQEHRPLLRQPGFWSATALAALMCLPILIWNINHDWIGYRHVNTLAGNEQGTGLQLLGPFIYLAQQFAVLLGFWFVIWLAALWKNRPWREADAGKQYLWWLSVPMFTVFLLFSLKTGGGEINWPATAYLSGLVLAAGWLAEQFQPQPAARTGWYGRCLLGGAIATATLGITIVYLMHFSERVYPLLARLAGPPTLQQPFPLRRLDPTCRLRGWQTLAAEVDRLRAGLHAEGTEPVLAGSTWWLPGQLAFYCTGQPLVYCFGPVAGSRSSQYDLWEPNPLSSPEQFQGRTFILIGDVTPALREAFDEIETRGTIQHRVRGQTVNAWPISIGRGYRGALLPIGQTNY